MPCFSIFRREIVIAGCPANARMATNRERTAMLLLRSVGTCLLICGAAVGVPVRGVAQATPTAVRANTRAPQALRDGQHDVDFEIGTWKTHLKRLMHPLTGSKNWGEYDGTTVVRKVLDGRANLVELVAD